MSWIKVLSQSELPEGTQRVVRAEGRSILLIRNQGKLWAIQSSCPHMAWPLQFGRLTGDEGIVCALHHSAFDLNTGDVKDWSPWPPVIGPMLQNVSRRKALPIYPARVQDGSIWVDVPEA